MTSQSLRKPRITPSNNPSGRPALRAGLFSQFCCSLLAAAAGCSLTGLAAAADQPHEKSLGQAWQSHLGEMLDGVNDVAPFESTATCSRGGMFVKLSPLPRKARCAAL